MSDCEQLNLFEQNEESEQKERWFRENTKMYHQWLNLPDKILIKEGMPERESLSAELWHGYCKLYQHAYHKCETMPQDVDIWENPTSKDYWVLHTQGELEGKKVDVCPYCDAELGKGKGDAVLYKAEPKYWLFYLYFDVPMHERGYQTAEEHQKIMEVWG